MFSPSGFNDIGIRKFEFGTKTQFLFLLFLGKYCISPMTKKDNDKNEKNTHVIIVEQEVLMKLLFFIFLYLKGL